MLVNWKLSNVLLDGKLYLTEMATPVFKRPLYDVNFTLSKGCWHFIPQQYFLSGTTIQMSILSPLALWENMSRLFSTRALCLHFDSAPQKEKECSIPVSLTEQALGQDEFCNHCQFPVTTRWPAFSIVSLNGGGGMSMGNKNCRNKKRDRHTNQIIESLNQPF